MPKAPVYLLLLLCAGSVWAQTREEGPVSAQRTPAYTGDIIVEWRTSAADASMKTRELGAAFAPRIEHKTSLRNDVDVFKTTLAHNAAELEQLVAELNARPDVVYAVADQWRYAHAIPADPLFTQQWYLMSTQPAATRTDQAWDVAQGDPAIVVAVLDSGVRFEHPDLSSKLLTGYDFVSNAAVANDGSARDGDASDPGDWVTEQDIEQPPFNSGSCEPTDSSWHGTRVASLIGAATNNSEGIAGGGWDTRILPVRVLGKCGGSDADIIAGMRWAAGLSVPGAPANPTPAHIINLSLGAEGVCNPAYSTAINEIQARGVLIVASAGNEGKAVNAPANCGGVLAIGALRHVGTKVGYSNLGPEVALSAPGGNCGTSQVCEFPIMSASNTGTTTPAASTYTTVGAVSVGTSFSAPLVAAALALMRSVNTQLSPLAHTNRLLRSATPFPTVSTAPVCRVPASADDVHHAECVCTAQTCGAGMLNAHAAVLAALRPAAVLEAPAIFDVAERITLNAASSLAANQRTITGWQWSVVNVVGAAPVITAPNQSQTTLQVAAGSQFTLQLTVTDDQGAQDTMELAMATRTPPSNATPSAPAATGSGGGGGGALDWAWTLLLSAALLLRRRHQLGRQFA